MTDKTTGEQAEQARKRAEARAARKSVMAEHAQALFDEVRPEATALAGAALSHGLKAGITTVMKAAMQRKMRAAAEEKKDV